MKKFTKEDLVEKLGLTEEKASLVMKAQKEFPELLQDDNKGVINSVRDLYLKLGIDKSNWSRWIKKNIKENSFFLENKDWWGFVIMTNGNEVEDFRATVEFAKHLCMTAKTEKAHEIRCYFIYLETAIKDIKDWTIIREPEKQGYKEMEDEIANWCDRNGFDKSLRTFYTREANMLNIALTGLNAQGIKLRLGYKDDNTRDHLQADINKALYELQILNKGLLSANLPFETRKDIITQTCKTKYEHLILTTE